MKKLVLSGLVIMSSLGQASEKLEEEKKWHFNMSVYKDYTSNLDAKFSYDVHRSGDFSLALGLGGSAIDIKDVEGRSTYTQML